MVSLGNIPVSLLCPLQDMIDERIEYGGHGATWERRDVDEKVTQGVKVIFDSVLLEHQQA